MSKPTIQNFVVKLHSDRLSKAKWNLTLPLDEARRNDEIVALASSQMIRWIDELNGIHDRGEEIISLKKRAKAIKRQANSIETRKKLKKIYARLDELQFKQDLLIIVMDRTSHMKRAAKGFKMNGQKYVRLVATAGQVKTGSCMYISERLAPEIRRRIDNGRNPDIPLVPAKLEAYRALTCSSSYVVTFPRIAVVPDCVTHFKEDTIFLDDAESDEPTVEYVENADLELVENDGYGLILPKMAEQWSDDLGLSYTPSCFNARISWGKGILVQFDFIRWSDEVAGSRKIKDVWGHEVDLSDVDVIMSESQLKLWDSYESCDAYLKCCEENHYEFCVTKYSPELLDEARGSNYQFLAPMHFSDSDIEELISPSVNSIKNIISQSAGSATLFLHGPDVVNTDPNNIPDDFAKALMIEPRMMNDAHVMNKIYGLVKKRIKDLSIGVVDLHANFTLITGDPVAFMENAHGMEVKGVLPPHHIYSSFWREKGVSDVVCMRAPMSTLENIVKMHVNDSPEAEYWFQHIKNVTVMSSQSGECHSLNGADKDGDLIYTTDNPVILRNFEKQPVIVCAQRRAAKKVVTEDDLLQSNIDGKGDQIGVITNHTSAETVIRSKFPKGSREYEELTYRIRAGQLHQQNAIDKTKGIIVRDYPKTWYSRKAILTSDMSDEDKEFYLSIVADKKPYFQQYIYPLLRKEYTRYISNTNRKAIRLFRKDVDELKATPEELLTDEERKFLEDFKIHSPVIDADDTINRICHRVEAEFKSYVTRVKKDTSFDPSILKTDMPYTNRHYWGVKKVYDEYMHRLESYNKGIQSKRVNTYDASIVRTIMSDDFRKRCEEICPNAESLCNIIIDMTYMKEKGKPFAWSVCGEQIIKNLLKNNGYKINMPVLDENGEIEFRGHKYRIDKIDYPIEEDEDCTFMSEVTEEDIMPLNINSTEMETQISA